MVSDRVMRAYMAIIQDRLCRYRHHPEWEDMLSCVYIDVVRALDRLSEAEQEDATGLVVVTAYHAACSFFDSPANSIRTVTSKGVPLRYTTEPLRPQLNVIEPDFAPILIDRLWREHLWEEAARILPPHEWQSLRDRCTDPTPAPNTLRKRATRAAKKFKRALEG